VKLYLSLSLAMQEILIVVLHSLKIHGPEESFEKIGREGESDPQITATIAFLEPEA
jgi:hypothetical protein